jgi:hypothetical protein
MKKQDHEAVEGQLLKLGQRFQAADAPSLYHQMQTDMPEWVGADVRVTSDPHDKPTDWLDNDAVVMTRHAKPLTWLFFELRDIFAPWVNAGNKHGFFGALGQAARGYLAKNQPEGTDHRPLLAAVLDAALQISRNLEKGLPPDANIVVHGKDAQGRPTRKEVSDEPTDA